MTTMELLKRGRRVWKPLQPTPRAAAQDPWTAEHATAGDMAALPISMDRYLDLLPLWAVARLCVLAPAVVLASTPQEFTAYTPVWLWQMRLDAIRHQSAGASSTDDELDRQPTRKLEKHIGLVAVAMSSGRTLTATLVLETAREAGYSSDALRTSLAGLAQKWPGVLDLLPM
ncbi:hypothetical protein BC828DRAFT_377252 [Blastocladiella britannica]|nr:hypothetical protein BC828DRAFT_377252 [Blastocladiella britannica]